MCKSKMAGRRNNKKRIQYCTDPSGDIVYLRALQGQSDAITLIFHYRTIYWFPTILGVHLSQRMCNEFTLRHESGLINAQGALPNTFLLMKARTSMLKMKQLMIEQRNPLFAVKQITINQSLTELTSTSEFQDCHILLWSKLRALVFENWLIRSRTTQINMLFNEIYNKTKLTTRSVRRKIQDVGNGRAVWIVWDGP